MAPQQSIPLASVLEEAPPITSWGNWFLVGGYKLWRFYGLIGPEYPFSYRTGFGTRRDPQTNEVLDIYSIDSQMGSRLVLGFEVSHRFKIEAFWSEHFFRVEDTRPYAYLPNVVAKNRTAGIVLKIIAFDGQQ